jgi:hypothetical protein
MMELNESHITGLLTQVPNERQSGLLIRIYRLPTVIMLRHDFGISWRCEAST